MADLEGSSPADKPDSRTHEPDVGRSSTLNDKAGDDANTSARSSRGAGADEAVSSVPSRQAVAPSVPAAVGAASSSDGLPPPGGSAGSSALTASSPKKKETRASKQQHAVRPTSASLGRDGEDFVSPTAARPRSGKGGGGSLVRRQVQEIATTTMPAPCERENGHSPRQQRAGQWRPPTPPKDRTTWLGWLTGKSAAAAVTNDTSDVADGISSSSASFDALNDNGASLDLEEARQAASAAVGGSAKRSRLVRKLVGTASKKSGGERHLLDQSGDFHDEIAEGGALASSTSAAAAGEEEKVRDECSFFYTGFDDQVGGGSTIDRPSSPRDVGRRRGRLHPHDGYYAASGEDGSMSLGLDSRTGAAGGGSDSSSNFVDARSRSAFLEQYESLNAHIEPRKRGGEPAEIHHTGAGHDLSLSIEGESGSSSVYSTPRSTLEPNDATNGPYTPPSPRSIPHLIDAIRHSSLAYVNSESGRVQMRLPMDNVRLLMDSNLEPGILSVEKRAGGSYGSHDEDEAKDGGRTLIRSNLMPDLGHGTGTGKGIMLDLANGEEKVVPPYRPRTSPNDEEVGLAGGSETEDKKLMAEEDQTDSAYSKRMCQKESLTYVLTVDEDLYRRLVQEVADSNYYPCGIYYCCNDKGTDKVGIGVAIALLMVVFIFLFVNTIVFDGS